MNKSLYIYSRNEAKRNNELDLWRDSFKENVNCRKAIEKAIATNFDGMHLQNDAAKLVIYEFGFDRVNYVLANTLKKKDYDDRFSHENKDWAKSFYIPKDESDAQFCVDSHPAVTDGFINQARRAWDELGLFNFSHCHEDSNKLDYENHVLVIRPEMLNDEYKAPKDQLFYADGGGFGCNPDSRGRKVMGRFLSDGERAHYYREDFIGVIKDEFLPDFAKERLAELTSSPQEEQDDGINMC